FNPVSFWYIYDGDAQLKYMILEVNNTFDERRLYLLRPGSSDGMTANSPHERPRGSKLTFQEKFQCMQKHTGEASGSANAATFAPGNSGALSPIFKRTRPAALKIARLRSLPNWILPENVPPVGSPIAA
ncbi:MAG: DUF1365 family protein, partial [Proteobacteria bacterium]